MLFGRPLTGDRLRLAAALEIALPHGWRVERQDERTALIQRPEGPLHLRVDPVCDPWGRRNRNLTRHVHRGEPPPPGLRWDPAQGCIWQVVGDYDAAPGPHLVLLEARPFGEGHFYRIECAWLLPSLPADEAAALRLSKRQPLPLLAGRVLPLARLDPDRVDPAPRAPAASGELVLGDVATFDLPADCRHEAPGAGERRHLVRPGAGPDRWSLWLETDRMNAGAAPLPPDLLADFARTVRPDAAEAAAPRRPDARPYRHVPRADELLLAWRHPAQEGEVELDVEFALRLRRWRRGTLKLFYRLYTLLDARLDPLTQAAAEELWQGFLAARFAT